MRYPASEKLEIIRLVERSHLPVRRTLDKLGIPSTTFYRWYDRYRAFAEAGLEDRTSGPGRVWNRIPDNVRRQIVDLALDEPELSPRELAVTFTDTKGYFVSEASVYRLLKAHDLITSPAFVVIKAADEFRDKTTAPNQLWQTDFTYLKVIGWDACGIVEAVGAEVKHYQPGDHVMYAGAIDRPGSYSQYQLVDERIVGRKPLGLDFVESAALPLTSLTAWEALIDRLHLDRTAPARKERSLLIIGGAGGVGSMAIQLARSLADNEVIVTASRPETQK
jgi:transposase-like protein